MRNFSFLGIRTIKTGIAVLITALICELLHWPPVFAVITAIVAIEPKVADYIKKGVPPSAIGSFYAVQRVQEKLHSLRRIMDHIDNLVETSVSTLS